MSAFLLTLGVFAAVIIALAVAFWPRRKPRRQATRYPNIDRVVRSWDDLPEWMRD